MIFAPDARSFAIAPLKAEPKSVLPVATFWIEIGPEEVSLTRFRAMLSK